MRCEPGGTVEVQCNGGGCGRFVRELRYDCHRQSLGLKIRCALQHAHTPTKRRYPERDVEGAVPYGGIGLFRLFSIIPKGYLHAPWRNSW